MQAVTAGRQRSAAVLLGVAGAALIMGSGALSAAPIAASSTQSATAAQSATPAQYATPALGPTERPSSPKRPVIVAGEALLKPLRPLDSDALEALSRRTGLILGDPQRVALGWVRVSVRALATPSIDLDDAATQAAVAALRSEPELLAAEEIRVLSLLRVPSDPGAPQQWALDAIGARAAWNLHVGSASQRIGIVDSGILQHHEDLVGRIAGGFNFVQDGSTAAPLNGRNADFSARATNCPDGPWHGTAVAGVIGAVTDNGVGMAGLNWEAGLVIARAGACDSATTVDIMEAAMWLAGATIPGVPDVGANKVQVINMSVGSSTSQPCSAFQQDAVDFIRGQGVTIVAAAGNNDGGPVTDPANCDGVISVGALGPDNHLVAYSALDATLDIAAPGGDSSQLQGNGGVGTTSGPNLNDYRLVDGTSFAAPHVAGAASLVLAVNPALSPSDVETILRHNGGTCAGCGLAPSLRIDRALTATPSAPIADDLLEPNDTPLTATLGLCGDRLSLQSRVGNEDWVGIDGRGSSLSVSVVGALQVVIQDAGGNELARGVGASGGTFSFPEAGAMFIGVLPGAADEGYSLHLGCGASSVTRGPLDSSEPGPDPTVVDDRYEENDSVQTAKPLICGADGLFSFRDADYFTTGAEEGRPFAVKIDTGGLDLSLTLLDEHGTVLATGRDGHPARPKAPPGTIVVRISSEDGLAGRYRLAIDCGTPPPVEEPGICGAAPGSVGPAAVVLLLVLEGRLRRRRPARAQRVNAAGR